MKYSTDTGDQLQALMKHLPALMPVFGVMLLLSFAYPVENWRRLLAYGVAGLLGGAALALLARRGAERGGLSIEAETNQWPNRWTLLRAAGWLIAVASIVGALAGFIAGPHVIHVQR
jgi:hypothetical protein